MTRIEFDEEMGRALEVLYGGRDVLRRRQLVRDALGGAAGRAHPRRRLRPRVLRRRAGGDRWRGRLRGRARRERGHARPRGGTLRGPRERGLRAGGRHRASLRRRRVRCRPERAGPGVCAGRRSRSGRASPGRQARRANRRMGRGLGDGLLAHDGPRPHEARTRRVGPAPGRSDPSAPAGTPHARGRLRGRAVRGPRVRGDRDVGRHLRWRARRGRQPVRGRRRADPR